MAKKDVKIKDMLILDRYADLLKEDPVNALKRAIMEVYEYGEGDKYLSSKVSQIKKRLHVVPLADVCAAQGITKHTIAAKVRELMDANDPVIYQGKVALDEKEKPLTTPNRRAQVQGTQMAANMLGLIQRGQPVEIDQQTVNFMVIMETEEDARKRVAKDDAEHETVTKSYEVKEEARE